MCGIAGIVQLSDSGEAPSKEVLIAMIAAVRHRGPDEFGLYRDACAGLVHARLSIIDLTTGQQPLCNEDGTLWIVFNGEIFNYVELRKDLESCGHRFRTHSDTEVIVHAFEEWGLESFPRFNGQWAIALWSTKERKLVLSRDRVGVRPLYVAEQHGRLLFASEVKSIFADPRVPRRIDIRGLDQVFTYWSPLAPTTVFEGVEEVRPGSVRVYARNGKEIDRLFWSPSFPANETEYVRLSLQEATEALRSKLKEATRLRMIRSDVPVGSYLSGGIDSSYIAWLGRQAKEGDYRTFSIRFEDAEFDETEYQLEMAKTIDSNHSHVIVRRGDIAEIFPEVIRHTERPILRTAPAPMYLLSRLVRQEGIKAVLTGEGADEMLAGYDLFKEAKIRDFWSHQPNSKARPALFDRLYPYLARSPQQTRGMAIAFWKRGIENPGLPTFSHMPRWGTTSQLKRFFSEDVTASLACQRPVDFDEVLPREFASWDLLERAQYIEDVTLLSGYLVSSQGDRMLMANSVEGRFPFLDKEVMEFCNLLPPRFKLMGLNEKFILKKAAHGAVPERILKRAKQPYRSPDAASFVLGTPTEYVRELLSEQAFRRSGVFNPTPVLGLVEKCTNHLRKNGDSNALSNTDNMAFVGILSTQLLYHQFIEQSSAGDFGDVTFRTCIDGADHSPS